jgi:exosortase/archaeosortase family protein
MMKKIIEYIDLAYFIKFIVLFLLLYYFNQFYIGITAEGGSFYSPFLQHRLNYVAWIRGSVLHTSNIFAHALGVNTYVVTPYTLKVLNGPSVRMGYTCIGLENMSFWLAFVVSHSADISKKVIACLAGIFIIWLINCLRVTFLLMALNAGMNINRFTDHHTIYNIIAYLLIALMIYVFNSYENRRSEQQVSAI